MIRYALIALLVGLACGQRKDVSFWDCGSKAKVSSIQIEPCDSDPCVLKRGETSKVHFKIISDQDTKTVRLTGKFKAWFVWMPIPGFSQDLCKGVFDCPISKGEKAEGAMRFSIASYVLPMKTAVEFKISGDEGSSVCVRANVIIK
uniref:Putative ml domain protein n=1 Tax=Amblyomma sculptum TaxID=1581419 RepID=A0A1E1XT57_AMBSC